MSNAFTAFSKQYSGRLRNVVQELSSEDIDSFQKDITAPIDVAERSDGIQMKKTELLPDYSRSLSEIDPRQIFRLTEFRNLDSMKLARLPLDIVARALWEKDLILAAFNHPLRTKLRLLYKRDASMRIQGSELDPFAPLGPMNVSPAIAHELESGYLHAFEEFTVDMVPGEKVSRRLALAIGCYTTIGRNQIGIPFGSETMHTVIGNPTALADLLRCHAVASAPRNGIFSDPKMQAKLLLDTIEILENTNFLNQRGDREQVIIQWIENMGIVVESDPQKACERIEIVLQHLPKNRSIAHVRIYSVEASDEIVRCAAEIQSRFPHLYIHAGQISTVEHALRLEEMGIGSIGIGIASGSRCSTGARSGVPSQNINLLFDLRKHRLTTPIFAETGIPEHALPIALASGIRRVNLTGALLGFLSSNGGWYVFEDNSGKFWHPYDGEASEEAKRIEERVYSWGMPIMIEGVNGWFQYGESQKSHPTIPHKLWFLAESVALTTSFHRHVFMEDLLFDTHVRFSLMSSSMRKQVLPK